MVHKRAGRAAAISQARVGIRLLRLADETARALGSRGVSVIVSDANTGARRLYECYRYSKRATRLMVKRIGRTKGRVGAAFEEPVRFNDDA